MIYCPVCNASNRNGSKFCNDCGASLGGGGAACPVCQTRNPVTSRYCSSCGSALPGTPPVMTVTKVAVSPAPPSLAEIEDELPSLEADVPPFAEPASLTPVSSADAVPESTAPFVEPYVQAGSLPTLPDGAGVLDKAPPWTETAPRDRAAERPLPDWLALSDIAVFADPEEAPPASSADHRILPGWLDLREEDRADGRHSEVPSAPVASGPELPPWLLLVEPAPEEATVPTLPEWLDLDATPDFGLTAGTPPRSLPGWLSLAEAEPSALTSISPVQRVLPDWLSLPEPGSEEGPAEGPVAGPAIEALPDWLLLAEEASGPAVSSQVPVLAAERTLPEWLFLPAEGVEPEPEAGLPAAIVSIPRGLPDWLLLPEVTPLEVRGVATPGELPAWLSLPETSRSLPDWLFVAEASRPVEPMELVLPETAVEPVAEVAVETMAPVAEAEEPPVVPVAEAEPVDVLALPGIALARPFQTPPSVVVSSPVRGQVYDYTRVFADLAQPTAEPDVVPTAVQTHRSTFMSILLIAVVTIPLLVPMWINVEPGQSSSEVFKTIQALPPTANVLVSFDWGAGNDDEMAPIAEAIVRHLVRKQVKIVAVSLLPEGAKLAQRTIDRSVLAKSKSYVYGQQVVNLGYLPGGEAAIQAMSNDIVKAYRIDYRGAPAKDIPLLKEFKSVKNADLVVELAGEPEMLQKWVTQLSSRYPGIRMVAGVSAASQPWAEPFSSGAAGQSQQLKGTVAGIRGAAEYEWESNDPNDTQPKVALPTLDAQSFGGAFLVLVIVVGNLAHLRSRFSRPKAAPNSSRGPARS